MNYQAFCCIIYLKRGERMAYKLSKYEINRRKAEKFRKTVHRKAVSDWKKIERQKEAARNKRLREYKREKEKREKAREKERAKTATTPQEPLTGSEVLSVFVFLAIIVVLFILICKFGFLMTVLISLIVLTIAIIINATIEGKKAERAAEMEKYLNAEPEDIDRRNQIPYLKSLLGEIRKHQTIVNTSNDPEEVKKHLDCLLGVMDEITTFDEDLLKEAGMTKANYESARADLLEVYDVMIAQARENSDADSNE